MKKVTCPNCQTETEMDEAALSTAKCPGCARPLNQDGPMYSKQAPLEGKLFISAAADATGKFMFMPGGTHEITCSRNGKPVTVNVEINAKTVDALNQQLALVSKAKAPHKPYCDFNHDKDMASFWPQSFSWENGAVYVSGEFSASGKAAIEGKDYRGFSPTFFVDDIDASPAHVICNASAGLNFGGLVNEPAFNKISPLWARNAAGARNESSTDHTETIMTKEQIAALQAKTSELESQVKALNAKASLTEIENADLSAKQAEHRALKAEVRAAELEAKDLERRETDARAAVQAAVKDGRIPAQSAELQAKWTKQLTEDPSSLVMLEAMSKTHVTTSHTSGIQAVSEDPRNVLKAYAQNRDARSRGELYAREISPLLAKGQGLIGLSTIRPDGNAPLEAANSFGTLVGNIIAQRVLELLRFQLPMLSRISSDFSDQQVKYNQSVITRYIGIPSVGTYNSTTGYPALSNAAATDVSVTINQHKCVELDLTAEQLAGTARRLFDEQIPAMSYALALDLVTYIMGLITQANFTNPIVTEAIPNFGRSTLVNVAEALTKLGVPIGSQFRTLLLNSDYFGQLQKDSSIIQLAAFQKPEYIQENQLPPVAGFAVIEAPYLPSTANLTGFGFSKSALVAATRLPIDYTTILPGASFGQVNTVTDPDTGASMMQVAYVNHTLGTANFRMAWMYGASAGQIKAGQIITSS